MLAPFHRITLQHTNKSLLSVVFERVESSHKINCCIHNEELLNRARSQAEKLDEEFTPYGLHGAPIAVKDNFCLKGIPTTCSSQALSTFVPQYTATVVERLAKQGAIMVAKTNMDEFGMGSFNIHSKNGPVLQELAEKDHVSGGSSGGSAAAVSHGICAAALGSDTGGSVRTPASYTGVVGWKPSYGRSSRYGLVPFASSFDTPGVLANSVRDAAIVANAMSGSDPLDSTCTLPPTDYVPTIGNDLKGKVVGVPMEYWIDEMSPLVHTAWCKTIDMVKQCGGTVKEISLPTTSLALPAYYILSSAETSSNLAKYDGMNYGLRAGEATDFNSVQELITESRHLSFGPEVVRRILIGTFVLSRRLYESYYIQAQKVRTLVCNDFESAFRGVDVILTPTTPTTAPTLEEAKNMSLVETYANDVYTVPTSLAGLPAISIPVQERKEKYPIGMQLIGKYGDEESVLYVAQVLEECVQSQAG
eukprot:m.211967 g.211967  ORF g.211967 m.211967 type:complete len:476 (-) comp15843_c0_seq6:35-1462(-)